MGGIDEVSSFREYSNRDFIISVKDMWWIIKQKSVLPGQIIMCGNENLIIFIQNDEINLQQNVEVGGVCGVYRNSRFYDYYVGEMSIEEAFEHIIDGFNGQTFI
jgi:hypothetical protein